MDSTAQTQLAHDDLQLGAALAAINAKRRADGLPELAGFAQAAPPPGPAPHPTLAKEQQGQALLMKRRIECGIAEPPPYQPAPPQLTLPELLARLRSETTPGKTTQAHGQLPARQKPAAPLTVRVWVGLALAASRGAWGGAIRAWSLAQSLDPHGAGQVEHSQLAARLEDLVASRSTRCRWLREAQAAGFLQTVRGGTRYLIASTRRVCLQVGVTEPGVRIEVDGHALCQAGWKGLLWAGQLTNHPRPVSRAFLQRTTGVPRRTQLEYDKAGQVTATPNFAVDLQADSSLIDGYREFKRAHAFVVPCGGAQRIAYRIPNSYQPPETVKRAGGLARSAHIRQQVIATRGCGMQPSTCFAQPTVSETSESAAGISFCTFGDPRTIAQSHEPVLGNGSQVGGASHGETGPGPQQASLPAIDHCRLYFDRAADLRKMLRFRSRKGLPLDSDTPCYTLMPGGISRRARWTASHWWRIEI